MHTRTCMPIINVHNSFFHGQLPNNVRHINERDIMRSEELLDGLQKDHAGLLVLHERKHYDQQGNFIPSRISYKLHQVAEMCSENSFIFVRGYHRIKVGLNIRAGKLPVQIVEKKSTSRG